MQHIPMQSSDAGFAGITPNGTPGSTHHPHHRRLAAMQHIPMLGPDAELAGVTAEQHIEIRGHAALIG